MELGICGTSSFHRFEIRALEDELREKIIEIAQLKEGIKMTNVKLNDEISQLKERIRKDQDARAFESSSLQRNIETLHAGFTALASRIQEIERSISSCAGT